MSDTEIHACECLPRLPGQGYVCQGCQLNKKVEIIENQKERIEQLQTDLEAMTLIANKYIKTKFSKKDKK